MSPQKKRKSKSQRSLLWSGGTATFGVLTVFMLALTGLSGLLLHVEKDIYHTLVVSGGRSVGIVERIDEQHTYRSSSYRPVAFYFVDGKKYTHEFSNVNDGPNNWSVGDSFQVAYDKNNPNHAVAYGKPALAHQNFMLWKTAVGALLSGALFVGYLATLGFKVWRQRHPKPRLLRSRKN